MKNLTTFVHDLFCQMNHLQTMEDIKANKDNPEVCLFYLERVLDTEWESRDHLVWMKKTKELLEELAIENPAQLHNLINQGLALTRAASPLIAQHPEFKKILIELIESM